MSQNINKLSEKQKDEIKLEIRSLVISSGCEMTIKDLINDYSNHIGKNLTKLITGYKNVEDFLKTECSDIIRLKDKNGYLILCPIISQNTKSINKLIMNSKTVSQKKKRSNKDVIYQLDSTTSLNANKNQSRLTHQQNTGESNESTKTNYNKFKTVLIDNVRSNFQILIKEEKKIISRDLLSKYCKKFHEKFDYNKLGFDSVISMCKHFSDIFAIERDDNHGQWILYDKNMNDRIDKHSSHPDDTSHELFSVENVNIEYKISNIPLPSKNSQINIIITSIIDPSNFWFKKRCNDNSNKLKLLSDMNDLYKNRPVPTLEQTLIKPGIYCAALYEDIYYRAIIVSNVNRNITKIRYIDVGIECHVNKSRIKVLLNEFTKLPIQALKGQLAYMKPVREKWTSAAVKRFSDLVFMSTNIEAKVSFVDNDHISHLNIIDTSSPLHTMVSNVLYFEGFGTFDDNFDLNDACDFYKRHTLQLSKILNKINLK